MTNSRRGLLERRPAIMLAMYRDGNTLQQIGDKYAITRERVRQILSKHYKVTSKDGGVHARYLVRLKKEREKKNQRCYSQFGCSLDEYSEALYLGKEMMRGGLNRERTPRGAFQRQKENARGRGIKWNLTFGQWWRMWLDSGQFQNRGRKRGQYVMSRIGDTGPYEVGNVYIIKCEDNCRLARSNKPNQVRPEEQRGIYLLYPGRKCAYVAKINRRYIGQFATEEEAYQARRAALAA